MTATTSDEQSLHAAILANPACDTARLAYADWLDENGEPERAEFIRVQVELAAIESEQGDSKFWGALRYSHATCSGCSPWCRANRRQHDLFAAHEFQWFTLPTNFKTATEDSPDGRPLAIVARGFLSEVTCTAADWLTHGATILREHPIAEVNLPEYCIKIDPPGTDHGWQLYYYRSDPDSYFAMSGGLGTRAEMVARLMSDVRDLESEFA